MCQVNPEMQDLDGLLEQKRGTDWTTQRLECYTKKSRRLKGKLPKRIKQTQNSLKNENRRMHILKKLSIVNSKIVIAKAMISVFIRVRGAQLNPSAWTSSWSPHQETVVVMGRR